MSNLIDRQKLIDALIGLIPFAISDKATEAYSRGLSDAYNLICQLPSAEPEKEKAKRVLWTGWKGYRDTRYKCPNCKKPVKNDDIYCHRCGQRLMFPHISFTDYIPGEKQETIVRWDDE